TALTAGGFDETMRLWEVATGKELRRFKFPGEEDVTSVAFSRDGRTALSGSVNFQDNQAPRRWEAATGKELGRFHGHSSGVRSVAFSRDGRTALSASADEMLKLWDLTGL